MKATDVSVAGVWRRLAEPSPLIVDPAERRAARLLSRLLVVMVPLAWLSAIAQFAADGTVDAFDIALGLAIFALMGTYVLSRTRYSWIAALITTVIPTVGGLGVLATDAADPGWFAFMALNPALGSLLLKTRTATWAAVAGYAALVVACLLESDLDSDTVSVALSFNAMVTAVLLIARRHRNHQERDRRAELVARQRLNESVLAASFGGIAMVRDGRIEEANAAFAEAFAISPQELVGLALDELLIWETAADDPLASIIGNGPAEATARRLDGSEFDAEIVLARPDGDEDPPLVLAVRDVSERKRAMDAFVRAQRMESVGRLAAGIAHDTNNQLAVVGANVEVLLDGAAAPAQQRQHLQRIRNAAEQIASLVQRVLVASRRRVGDPVVVGLHAFVADQEPVWRDLVGEGVSLDVAVQNGGGHVLIDPIDFEQVLLNLVLNARDAMAGTGRLRIEVTSPHEDPESLPAGEYACIAVVDDGPGIPPDHLDRVFEAFFTTKAEESGTGLGLATCRDVIAQAGGSLTVRSRPGETVFRIRLPLVDAPAARSAADRAQPRGAVLIVDDTEAVRSTLAVSLRHAGFEVWEAADAAGAIEVLESRAADIDHVLTDLNMPGMAGDELARVVRERWPSITRVLMTGYATESTIGQDGDVILEKPFPASDLVELFLRGGED